MDREFWTLLAEVARRRGVALPPRIPYLLGKTAAAAVGWRSLPCADARPRPAQSHLPLFLRLAGDSESTTYSRSSSCIGRIESPARCHMRSPPGGRPGQACL